MIGANITRSIVKATTRSAATSAAPPPPCGCAAAAARRRRTATPRGPAGPATSPPLRALAFIHANLWLSLFPGVAIFFTVLGFNLFGDGLRDALDPRLK